MGNDSVRAPSGTKGATAAVYQHRGWLGARGFGSIFKNKENATTSTVGILLITTLVEAVVLRNARTDGQGLDDRFNSSKHKRKIKPIVSKRRKLESTCAYI